MVLQRDAASLDGRVAVVTGGGSGIGRGIAVAFADYGARVAVWEKDEATAGSAAAESGGLACVADVRDAGQVDAAMAATVRTLGIPTILVMDPPLKGRACGLPLAVSSLPLGLLLPP